MMHFHPFKMARRPIPMKCFFLLATLMIAFPSLSAKGETEQWNEPGRKLGYEGDGLLEVNNDYFTLSAATGGDFYFWAPGEFAKAAGQVNVPLASNPIALRYGNGDGPFTCTLEVPADGTISQLVCFSGAQLFESLDLIRPNGEGIAENATGASVQTFRHMCIVTVVDPEPGIWRAELRGEGRYELAVRYLSNRKRLAGRNIREIDLIDFSFVELGGRPGHEGFFASSKPPQVGSRQKCRLTLSGGIKEPVIDLISRNGTVLSEVQLEDLPDIPPDEFLGNVLVPDQAFRVRVRGEDTEGWPFQRITAGLMKPAE